MSEHPNMDSKPDRWSPSVARSTTTKMNMLATVGHSGAWGQSTAVTADWQFEEARQFDFWIGAWNVNLRAIRPDLTWENSIEARAKIYPVLDGKAILELWDSATVKGFSLRYFDPNLGRWVLFLDWPGTNGLSFSSLQGVFRHGRGEFFAKNDEVLRRYTFCDVTPTSLRWDDAYSRDGGQTWTNDWIMEFSRTAAAADWSAQERNAHTFAEAGTRCRGSEAEFGLIASVAGHWEGTVDFGGDRAKGTASARAYRILDGCATIQFLEFMEDGKPFRVFSALTYNTAMERFEELRLDNHVGSPATVLYGRIVDGTLKMLPIPGEWANGTSLDSISIDWVISSCDEGDLRIAVHRTLGGSAMQADFLLERTEPDNHGSSPSQSSGSLNIADAINSTCPRSGKPIVASSLAIYRERTVVFCNQRCRDDFAANVADRPNDRGFFDKILANRDRVEPATD